MKISKVQISPTPTINYNKTKTAKKAKRQRKQKKVNKEFRLYSRVKLERSKSYAHFLHSSFIYEREREREYFPKSTNLRKFETLLSFFLILIPY